MSFNDEHIPHGTLTAIQAQSDATWMLDAGDRHSVLIQGPQNSTLDASIKDTFLFDAGPMPAGRHQLEVTYQSGHGETPL